MTQLETRTSSKTKPSTEVSDTSVSGLSSGWTSEDFTRYRTMAQSFQPYSTPPPFDLDDYRDTFETWELQWKFFLQLSNIDTGVEA